MGIPTKQSHTRCPGPATVKTIGISLRASVKSGKQADPFEEAKLSLAQIGSKALLSLDEAGMRYLLLGEGEPLSASTLRVNWRSNQQIAISRTSAGDGTTDNDLGMFNLNFIFDNRYFPFEGTGAVSRWLLEMPTADYASFFEIYDIDDVIINLQYTSKVDRGSFRNAARRALQDLDALERA